MQLGTGIGATSQAQLQAGWVHIAAEQPFAASPCKQQNVLSLQLQFCNSSRVQALYNFKLLVFESTFIVLCTCCIAIAGFVQRSADDAESKMTKISWL